METLRRMIQRFRRKLQPRLAADGRIRLHLGCGSEYRPGWVNVDNQPGSVCDLCLDFVHIGARYPADSVAEIAMIHSLSYLRLWQARDLLADLHRVLEPSGRLIIELPDLAKCCRHVLENEHDPAEYLEGVRALYAFDLDYIKRKKMFTPYAFGWSGEHLEKELEQIGFRSVTLCPPQTHGPRLWRDIRVEAVK